MTRINTNIASLTAQNALNQSQAQLQTALTRLSTGLQINSGADNPAGLIAAQVLGSDIVSANAGISNSQIATQLISTADSALGQVSNLLNNIRGLVSAAANTGALSSDQIAADQLQVDSSLQAIDQIAQTTEFQGTKLLDGSLNFLTTSAGTADLRASGTVGTVQDAAASGTLGTTPDAKATGSFGVAAGTAASATVTGSTGAVLLSATANNVATNGYAVTFTNAGTSTGASDAISVNNTAKTITVSLTSGSTAADAVAKLTSTSATSAGILFNASASTAGALFASTASGSSLTTATTAGGNDNNRITLSASTVGAAYNGVNIAFSNTAANGSETAAFDSNTDTLTVYKSATSNTNQVISAIKATGLFSASTSGDGLGTYASGFTAASVTSGGTNNNNLKISAVNAGAAYNNTSVDVIDAAAAGSETANYNATNNTLYIYANAASTTNQVIAAVNATGVFAAKTSGAGLGTYAAGTTADVTSGGANGNQFTLSARTGGAAYNNVNVDIQDTAAQGSETASYSAVTNTLTINANAASTTNQVVAAINNATGTNGAFSATAIGSGLGTYTAGTTTAVTSGGGTGTAAISGLQINEANFGTASSVPVNVTIQKQATVGQLTYSGGTLSTATTLQIGGTNGYQVFTFGAGATIQQIAAGLNASSDATGVTAAVDSTGKNLVLSSQTYGSSAFVSATALTGSFTTKDSTGATSSRAAGTDVQAQINGVQATGNGLEASIDTPSLNLSFNVNSNFSSGDSFNFSITGGGATFQLGPDVVSNQQARLGIQGVSTATLGGVDGTLYELQSGGAASLASNPELAANIVDEVISQVTDLSGRLGAFQSTTLQTNINSLTDTVANLTSAQSDIQDADYASESANLTRAQILVQAGTSVLSIANQAPQQVLALLKTS
jgi:flagellin